MQPSPFLSHIRKHNMNPIAGIIHIRKARYSTALHSANTHDMTYTSQHEAWEISVTADAPFAANTENAWYTDKIRQILALTNRYEKPSVMEIWNARVPAEHRTKILDEFLDALLTAQEQDMTKRILNISTETGERWFEWRGQIVRDMHNKPVRIAGSLIEIAEYAAAK